MYNCTASDDTRLVLGWVRDGDGSVGEGYTQADGLTLAECQSQCEGGAWAGCIGFSRYTSVNDTEASYCWWASSREQLLADDHNNNEALYTLSECSDGHYLNHGPTDDTCEPCVAVDSSVSECLECDNSTASGCSAAVCDTCCRTYMADPTVCASCVNDQCTDEGGSESTTFDLVAGAVISIFVLRLLERFELPRRFEDLLWGEDGCRDRKKKRKLEVDMLSTSSRQQRRKKKEEAKKEEAN